MRIFERFPHRIEIDGYPCFRQVKEFPDHLLVDGSFVRWLCSRDEQVRGEGLDLIVYRRGHVGLKVSLRAGDRSEPRFSLEVSRAMPARTDGDSPSWRTVFEVGSWENFEPVALEWAERFRTGKRPELAPPTIVFQWDSVKGEYVHSIGAEDPPSWYPQDFWENLRSLADRFAGSVLLESRRRCMESALGR